MDLRVQEWKNGNMEIFYILVAIGLVAIFWKALIGLFLAMGGILSILIPIAIICAIIYILTIIFWVEEVDEWIKKKEQNTL